ncbi:MAG: hypothetical protein GMKNLPBB_02475 [Myxococcota bacterium]|nr:hypothetical protein [Myxococcota bacterium]
MRLGTGLRERQLRSDRFGKILLRSTEHDHGNQPLRRVPHHSRVPALNQTRNQERNFMNPTTQHHCPDCASGDGANHRQHADHSREIHRINRIAGQLEGIRRMIEEGRYCPDILIQIRAARSAMDSLYAEVLEGHLRHCVSGAMRSGPEDEVETKINELMELFRKV